MPSEDVAEPVPKPKVWKVNGIVGETPHERAEDLWGYPPRRPTNCQGCNKRTELYYGPHCWLCCVRGVPMPGDRFVRIESLTHRTRIIRDENDIPIRIGKPKPKPKEGAS